MESRAGPPTPARGAPLHPYCPTAPVRPLLHLALALVVVSELGLRAPFHGNPLACCLLGAVFFFVRSESCSRAKWMSGVLLCSLVLLRAQGTPVPANHAQAPASTESSEVLPPLEAGRSVRTGRFRTWFSGLGWLEEADASPPISLLKVEDTSLYDGDWISIPAQLDTVPWPRGERPGAMAARFPMGVATLRADEIVRLRRTSPPDGFSAFPSAEPFDLNLLTWLAQTRRKLADKTTRLFPDETAGIARALLFGDRSELKPELADLFTRTGTRHLLAVSGLHVALAAVLLLLPLSRLLERFVARRVGRAGSRWVGWCSFAILTLTFATIAGFGSPVIRASFALVLATLARHLLRSPSGRPGRQADALSLWAFVLILELLFDARATRSLPIQLSYLATLGILIATRPIGLALRRGSAGLLTSGRALASKSLQPNRGVWWRSPLARLAQSVRLSLAASSAAVLATLPVVWHQFGESSPTGILATAIALPLFVFVMGALWLSTASAMGFTSSPLTELASAAIEKLVGFLELVDRLPYTPLALPERPILWVAGACTALLFAIATSSPRIGRIAALSFGLLLFPWTLAPSGLEVHLFDVGHGSAVLLRAPGEPCLIFDAGSRDRRHLYREALAPQLARWDIASPTIALSHRDRDHASGLARLIERYPPKLWLGEQPAELASRLPIGCQRIDLPIGAMTLSSNHGALSFTLLSGSAEPGNEGSRALAIEFGDRRLLLFGDSEGAGLSNLLEADLLRGPVDLLLFPHHGSESLWLSSLLERTTPEQIWISSATEPAVADELDRRALPWSSTYSSGSLSVRMGTIGKYRRAHHPSDKLPQRRTLGFLGASEKRRESGLPRDQAPTHAGHALE